VILWGATTEEDDRTLSWMAACEREDEDGIHEGTAAMVAAMLRDLGYQIAEVIRWEIRRLRTNYLDGKTWRDAWEVKVHVPVTVPDLPLQGTVTKSAATDATWKKDGEGAGAVEHVAFVDFADSSVAERAERIIGGAFGRELDVVVSHRGFATAQLLVSFGEKDVDEARVTKAMKVFEDLGAKTHR